MLSSKAIWLFISSLYHNYRRTSWNRLVNLIFGSQLQLISCQGKTSVLRSIVFGSLLIKEPTLVIIYSNYALSVYVDRVYYRLMNLNHFVENIYDIQPSGWSEARKRSSPFAVYTRLRGKRCELPDDEEAMVKVLRWKSSSFLWRRLLESTFNNALIKASLYTSTTWGTLKGQGKTRRPRRESPEKNTGKEDLVVGGRPGAKQWAIAGEQRNATTCYGTACRIWKEWKMWSNAMERFRDIPRFGALIPRYFVTEAAIIG